MRLSEFEIINYKAIKHIKINWDNLLVLIGENNCGKSCVLSALALFLSGSAVKEPLLFHGYKTDEANAIQLIGHFDELTSDELNQPAVSRRTTNSKWILKKRFWLEIDNTGSDDKNSWKEELSTYSAPEDFTGWPQPDTSWSSFGADYQTIIQQMPSAGTRPNTANREVLKGLVRQLRPDLITMGTPSWILNPGGGGNWKSNANSLLPRTVFIKAVQEATEEALSKDASTYGKLMNLIIENKLSQKQEILDLKQAFAKVMELFSPDAAHPENQAAEIRELEQKINEGLKEVIGGEAKIRTESPEIAEFLLPNTSLIIRDDKCDIDTKIVHQGHGLQRTLLMTLLQLLADAQEDSSGTTGRRSVILIVEEPELYMHPQMERKMRDLLFRLAEQPNFQVACCTHSPVFIDVANRHKSIGKMSRTSNGDVSLKQVADDIFVGTGDEPERQRLLTVSRFNSTVNEVFFANEVVVMEEFTAVAAFQRAAELTGLFERHPGKRRGVSIIDTVGKNNIPAFQKVLNAFDIPYRVIHDEDRTKPTAFAVNAKIMAGAGNIPALHPIHLVGPESIESTLNYVPPNSGKPYAAVIRIEELYAQGNLPTSFIQAMNFVYFGTLTEPAPE
jgi:predicted ATP-dependent endonuclease of OLD family